MTHEWEFKYNPASPLPMEGVGTLLIAGTRGHCIGHDGKRKTVTPQVQELMDNVARKYSKLIRDNN